MPSPADPSDCDAASLLQTTTKAPPIDWRLIRAADRPIKEDKWIASVLQDEVQRQRWRDWYEQPRYAVALNVGPWAVIAVAFRASAGDNALHDLFRNIDAHHHATAWAVSKTTRQIYRLAIPLPQEPSATAEPTAALAVAAQPDPHPRLCRALQIPAEAWQAPELRARWEAHLGESANWVLSRCHRPLTRVVRRGEFGSFTASDQLSFVGSVFDDALEIETLPAQRHRRLYERLYRRERMLSIAVMKCIAATLDPQVVRQMREAGLARGVCAVSLNWLSEVSGASEARKRRLQALTAAPLLVPWLLSDRRSTRLGNPIGHEGADEADEPDGAAEAEEAAEVDEDDDIRSTQHARSEAAFSARLVALSRVVDGGDPLYPLLAHMMGVSLRTVRHLRLSDLRIHHLIERVDHRDEDQVASRLCWLDVIAVEQWPHTSMQWRLWSHAINELLTQCDFLSELLTPPPHPWIADVAQVDDTDLPPALGRGARALVFYRSLAKRRWRLQLGTAYDLPGDEDSAHAIMFVGMELRDFVRALREAVYDELDDDGEPALLPLPEAVIALLRHWQIEQWWAASSRWHTSLTEAGVPPEHHGGQRLTERDTPQWLPLLEHAFRVEGEHVALNNPEGDAADPPPAPRDVRVVRFLSTREMLTEEADTMQHCVGTYIRRCVTGRWHIASVTDANGVRCSTASFQLCFEQGRWTAQLVEHRGLRNAPASVQCAHAMRTVEGLLARQAMQRRFIEIEAARVERAAVSRELRFTESTRGQDVSLAALRAALPVNVFEALVTQRN